MQIVHAYLGQELVQQYLKTIQKSVLAILRAYTKILSPCPNLNKTDLHLCDQRMITRQRIRLF